MILDRITNLMIFAGTVVSTALCFRLDGRWNRKAGLSALRFFTLLSNLFCAAVSLLIAISLPEFSYRLWFLKYVSTCAVTVTFVTVMVFLGPAYGYKAMLSGLNFYLHLSGPLLALLSFCFMERVYDLPFGLSLVGNVPVLAYGLLYLYEVVLKARWEDFYGFNKGGKWPVSMTAMYIGGFMICVLVRFLYDI